MNQRTRLSFPLVLLLLAPLTAAQTETKPKPETKPAAKAPRASTAYESKVQLHLRVTGLTGDNMDKVRDGLNALTYSAYVCDHCQVQRSAPGKCPQCNAELKAEKKPLFSSVMPAPEDSTITLALVPDHVTRLSDIESALRANSVTVDEAALPIPGRAELVLRGGKAESVGAVEKALQDARLFDELHARWDATNGEIRVSARAGAMSPTHGKVESAIEGLKLQLKDVVWGRPAMKA